MTDAQMQKIYDEALKASVDAITAYRKKYGEPMYCGFAWVNVKPGTQKFAKWLVKKDYAHTAYHGGVDVWGPGAGGSQSMDLKEEGAEAFAAVLRKYDIKCSVGSRAD